jgi:hypothetical protein
VLDVADAGHVERIEQYLTHCDSFPPACRQSCLNRCVVATREYRTAFGVRCGARSFLLQGAAGPTSGASANAVADHVEKTMPSISHRRVAAVAIVSTLALIALSADAVAKSSRSKSRAAAAGVVQPGSSPGAGSYYYPQGSNIPPYTYRPASRGNVIDNTAGWGDVGAR